MEVELARRLVKKGSGVGWVKEREETIFSRTKKGNGMVDRRSRWRTLGGWRRFGVCLALSLGVVASHGNAPTAE